MDTHAGKSIPVVHASATTPEEFYNAYIEPCVPAVLEGAMEGTGSIMHHAPDSGMVQRGPLGTSGA